jgi:hypothetical protein
MISPTNWKAREGSKSVFLLSSKPGVSTSQNFFEVPGMVAG